MINWILNQKTNTIVYLFYLPWLLIFIFLLTPFYVEYRNFEKVILLILWIQFCFYYYITLGINTKLLLLSNNKLISKNRNLRFKIHSWLNILLITIITLVVAMSKNSFELIGVILIFLLLVSELIRSAAFTKTIILSEGQENNDMIIYITTFFLVINPLIGLWGLHRRLRFIFKIN